MIFNEVYIGKKPEIQQMCDIMSESRQLYMSHKTTEARKKLTQMESVIEKFFGFGAFSLDLANDPSINAFTYPVGVSLDIDPTEALYTTTKNGYRFKDSANLAAISRITTGLFGNKNFSNDEVFAIFLHEIGHSFTLRSPLMEAEYDANKAGIISKIIIYVIISITQPNYLINAAELALTSTNFIKLFVAQVEKLIKKIPLVRSIGFEMNKAISYITRGIYTTADIVFTATGLNYLVTKLNNQTQTATMKTYKSKHPNAYARSLERLSDDFVTTYGFGNELASALLKLDNREYTDSFYRKFQDNCPLLNKLYKAQRELAYEYVWAVGAHPSAPDRILSIIENMEYDIKHDKNLSEKEKRALKNQLKYTKKIADDAIHEIGEINNRDEYLKTLTILGFKNGSSETQSERDYTDMKELQDKFDDLHESFDFDMNFINFDF